MKIVLPLLFISSAAVLFSGCSSMNAMHDKLADMEMQKKQLANGQTVYLDINLEPTPAWGCDKIGARQAYDWRLLQTEGQFTLSGKYGLFTEKAIAYANQNNLSPNYINLIIPEDKSFSVSVNKEDIYKEDSTNNVYADYYQCDRINPEHKIGVQTHQDTNVNADF